MQSFVHDPQFNINKSRNLSLIFSIDFEAFVCETLEKLKCFFCTTCRVIYSNLQPRDHVLLSVVKELRALKCSFLYCIQYEEYIFMHFWMHLNYLRIVSKNISRACLLICIKHISRACLLICMKHISMQASLLDTLHSWMELTSDWSVNYF